MQENLYTRAISVTEHHDAGGDILPTEVGYDEAYLPLGDDNAAIATLKGMLQGGAVYQADEMNIGAWVISADLPPLDQANGCCYETVTIYVDVPAGYRDRLATIIAACLPTSGA